jgi:hypothetical protein
MTEATAADLIKLTAYSVRVAEPLKKQIKDEGDLSFSYANTLLCLCAEVLRAFHFLVEAHFRKQVQHAAWAARNLLELSIWCEYCARSESNARTFCFDTVKDALGLVNAFAGIVQMGQGEGSGAHLLKAVEKLKETAAAQSLDLNDDFTKVHKAARGLGKEQEMAFRYGNIILSKFTHPTAYIVNINIDEASQASLVELSYKIGLALATASLNELEKASILRPERSQRPI